MSDQLLLCFILALNSSLFLTDGNSLAAGDFLFNQSIFQKICHAGIPLRRVCFAAKLPLNSDDLDYCIDGREQQGFAMPAGVTWHSMTRHIMCHVSIFMAPLSEV